MTELIFVLVVLLLLAVVWLYNRLVRNRNQVSEAWAGLDVQLQLRSELVPNLVQSVKRYTKHESEVLHDVSALRGDTSSAEPGNIAARAEQETQLSRSPGRLFALAEAYPDLKTSENFQQLHTNLIKIEDQLQPVRSPAQVVAVLPVAEAEAVVVAGKSRK